MVMLRGTVQINIQDSSADLLAGDTITIPAGTPHSLANTSEQDAQWLIIFPATMQFHGPDGQPLTPDWTK